MKSLFMRGDTQISLKKFRLPDAVTTRPPDISLTERNIGNGHVVNFGILQGCQISRTSERDLVLHMFG